MLVQTAQIVKAELLADMKIPVINAITFNDAHQVTATLRY